MSAPYAYALPRDGLDTLIAMLRDSGRRVIGPRLRDDAVVFADLDSAAQLPAGVRDTQTPGSYRIEVTDTTRCFAYANTAQGLKPWLFAPDETLWRAERDDAGRLRFTDVVPDCLPLAILGVRACDLAGLSLLDAHFMQDASDTPADPHYAARRRDLLLIAVDCTHPAATCFCASTGDGPAATAGFDLALSELDAVYLVRAGSAAGEAVLQQLVTRLALAPASVGQQATTDEQTRAASAAQSRRLPGRDLSSALFDQLDHPQWTDVAARCLACGNCTAVCPTCFCHRETEHAALDGTHSEHQRQWDNCFSAGHSYIHGLTVRDSTRLRYRQWLTHKLAGWHAQYGRSGCVGCGRCITWCPVGIDITAEAAALCP